MDDSGGSFESLSTIQESARRLDPFWATRLWQKLIKETISNVRVCRQRHFLKNYENVFNGEDLVDVILAFLKQCPSELDVQRIDRTNALKVCQVLMEKKLFESVSPKGNLKFEDSSHKFYRFIEDYIETACEKSVDTKEKYRYIRADLIKQDKENISSPQFQNSISLTPYGKEFSRSGSIRRCSKRLSLRIKTPLMRVRDTKPSPVRFSKRNARDSDLEAASQELRETALALLLQLMNIELLESIIDVPDDLAELPEAPQPFILENDFTPRKINSSKQDFCGPVTDIPCVKVASACLGGHPPGLSGLWSVQACKVLCYNAVCDRFSCSVESIIPGEYFSICISIVQMLKDDRRSQALYALQLFIFHIPWRRQKQLQKLLQFLHLVVNDIFVSVDKKVTNYEAVLRDFLNVVFRHPLVSQGNQKILFDFILFKWDAIFQIPLNLQRCRDLGFEFCRKISVEEHKIYSAEYTKQCLTNLASSIIDNTDVKLADKKVWLKKLKKYHPNIHYSFTD